MQIQAYSPQTGALLASDISGINFGNIRQGEHCISPVLIQPVSTSEDLFSSLILYLQNNGGFSDCVYGYLVSSDLITGVQSYTSDATGPVISNYFTLVSNPSYASDATGGVPIVTGDYIWLDVEVGETDTGSTTTVNYRFIYEYN
jgi:hypothetical protein